MVARESQGDPCWRRDMMMEFELTHWDVVVLFVSNYTMRNSSIAGKITYTNIPWRSGSGSNGNQSYTTFPKATEL